MLSDANSDRPGQKWQNGLAIHDYLTRHGRCHVVDLRQAQAQLSKHLIIVCDVEIGNETSVKLLGAALTKHRVDDGIPVLFLIRDSSNLTASLALSLGATELIHSGAPPARILAVAERLIDSKNKGVTRPASTTEARALDAKSALTGCFDAVKRGKPVSIAELNKGANVVLSAINQRHLQNCERGRNF